MFFIFMLFFLVTILLCVAFFTLFERKILGYAHHRLGPNKSVLTGVGQPFNDLIKLFAKTEYAYTNMKTNMFMLSPLLMVVFSMMIWMSFSHEGNSNGMKYFLVFVMALNGVLIFFFLFPGWSSGSTYSILGGYRASAQCISYEGVFFFCFLCMIFMFFSFNLMEAKTLMNFTSMLLIMYPLTICWILSIMAETNRSPFDFAEGESELVSGFNTEYGSGMFSIIFLSEYMSMLFYSFLTSFFFFSQMMEFLLGMFLMMLTFVWIRLAFPRFRYDKLMVFSWKSLMFLITGILFLFSFFVFF